MPEVSESQFKSAIEGIEGEVPRRHQWIKSDRYGYVYCEVCGLEGVTGTRGELSECPGPPTMVPEGLRNDPEGTYSCVYRVFGIQTSGKSSDLETTREAVERVLRTRLHNEDVVVEIEPLSIQRH